MNTELKEEILNFDNNQIDPTIINREQIEKIVENLLIVLDKDIVGDVVELGCYVGESSKYLMQSLVKYNSTKKLYVYDSFEGLPDLSKWEENTGWTPRTLKTTQDVLMKNFINNDLPIPFVHKNWFKDIPDDVLPEHICFAFLDGDFYESIYDSLVKIFEKIPIGGYILFHDYDRPDLPGVRGAVEQFLTERGLQNTTTVIADQLGLYIKGEDKKIIEEKINVTEFVENNKDDILQWISLTRKLVNNIF